MKTTLRAIKACKPCTEGWKNLLAHLGKTKVDDEPLSILTILDSNGIEDALWCLRAVSGRDKEIRLYMVWCARRMPIPSHNPRIVAALDVAERFANGGATEPDLATARAAMAAEQAATRANGRVEEWAGAGVAALATARDVRRPLSQALDEVAWAAEEAALYGATVAFSLQPSWDAGYEAWAAERAAQEKRLRELCAECEELA